MLLRRIASLLVLAASLAEGGLNVAMPDMNVNGSLYLVNPQHMISEDYVPDTREIATQGAGQKMRPEAADALEALFEAAQADGLKIVCVSGYRSYGKQSVLYDRKLKSARSVEEAKLLVAMPGSSEHQMGVAMDVGNKGNVKLTGGFGDTPAGKWLVENAHKFGFIVRYPDGYTEVTGYAYEPWHIRYVGVAHATRIHDSGLPMEFYVSSHRLEVYRYLLNPSENEVLP